MHYFVKTAFGLAGLVAASSPASAYVVVTFDDTAPIPGSNDFPGELGALGLTQVATTGASLMLAEDSIITFNLLGSESGFDDTFSAADISYTEYTSLLNSFGSPIALGGTTFPAGSLSGILTFTSSGGVDATVGDDGFGIFLGPNVMSGDFLTVFYIGYDDQITNQDDDHDDLIIQATVTSASAVPEPSTWAMMLFGFGAVGWGMRRARRQTLTQVA